MFVGLLVGLLVISSGAFALQLQTGNIIEIAQGKVVNDNLLAAGEIIRIDGDVKGDLLAFGSEITITGNVDGNIITSGGEIVLSGNAKNVFAAGWLPKELKDLRENLMNLYQMVYFSPNNLEEKTKQSFESLVDVLLKDHNKKLIEKYGRNW